MYNNIITDQVPWPVMNSLISLDLDHNNFGDNLAEPGRFQGLNVLQVMMMMTLFIFMNNENVYFSFLVPLHAWEWDNKAPLGVPRGLAVT